MDTECGSELIIIGSRKPLPFWQHKSVIFDFFFPQVGMRDCPRAPTPASPFSKRPISRKLIFCEEEAVYMCRSGALHKALILKGLVRRRCSVRWSHIINLRSLFLPAFFFILQTQAPLFFFLAQSRYGHLLGDSRAQLIDLADAHDLRPVDF